MYDKSRAAKVPIINIKSIVNIVKKLIYYLYINKFLHLSILSKNGILIIPNFYKNGIINIYYGYKYRECA